MNDPITQMRLSMRLERYMSDYTEKSIKKDSLYRDEWTAIWNIADAARTLSELTPELVDDVRVALNRLEVAR